MQVFKFSSAQLLVAVFLIFCQVAERAHAQNTFVSWIFRGEAQQNNTVLTFNKGDTLNLVCKAQLGTLGTPDNDFFFAITIGIGSPLCILTAKPSFEVIGGTLIFDDMDGVQADFENVVVIQQGAFYGRFFGNFLRPVSIAYLRTFDAGMYHCCGISYDGTDYVSYYSGGITVIVNTKPTQTGSTRANGNRLLAYSALLLSSAKLIF